MQTGLAGENRPSWFRRQNSVSRSYLSFFKESLNSLHSLPAHLPSLREHVLLWKVLSTLLTASPSACKVATKGKSEAGNSGTEPGSQDPGVGLCPRWGMKDYVQNHPRLWPFQVLSAAPAPGAATVVFLQTPGELLTAEQNSVLFLAYFPHFFTLQLSSLAFFVNFCSLCLLQGVKYGRWVDSGDGGSQLIRELCSRPAPCCWHPPISNLPQGKVLNLEGPPTHLQASSVVHTPSLSS